jgi:probable galactosyltransferase
MEGIEEKINILELESSLGFGGQEHRTQRVINGLDKNIFKVFYGLNPGSKSFEKDIDCEFVEFNLKKSFNIFEILKICKFVKKNKIKIISTHSGKDGSMGAIVGKICGVSVVRTRHLQLPITSASSYNLSTKVVGVCDSVCKDLVKRGVKKEKVVKIYTGIDTNRYTPNFTLNIKKEFNLSDDFIGVCIVAVLRAAKNHKLLIDAFCELNLDKTALFIVGDGPQNENLKEYIKNKKNIFMLGNRTDVSDFLGSLDICVLPSDMEAIGGALLEASSCGLATIGSDVGGLGEAVNNGKSGFLFKNGDKEELKVVLERLIIDRSLRKQMGEFGRNYVKEIFSIDKMIENTQKLYFELVKVK